MTEHFSAGTRLLQEPSGDPRRQAVAALRGYAYQLYVSALAWAGLRQGERLYLEVVEDYAIAARDAVVGVQVKDTAASGSMTINTDDVLDALDSFVDLVERNPEQNVSLRFLTTSPIGKERDTSDRVAGIAVLEYWRLAASGAEVAPLRAALLRASISGRARSFIRTRDDERLRLDLLKRIHWDCGQANLEEVREQLEATLVEFGSERLQLSPSASKLLLAPTLEAVLDTIVSGRADRVLVLADLLRLCEERTKITIGLTELAKLQQMALAPASAAFHLEASALFESVDELPWPTEMAAREEFIASALARLQSERFLALAGGSGMGKTIAARLIARAFGGRWLVLDLHDLSAKETSHRLGSAFGLLAFQDCAGVILDDLNEIEVPDVARRLTRIVSALRRKDAACIVTGYRTLSVAVLEKLGVSDQTTLRLPNLSLDEVACLARQAGSTSAEQLERAYAYSGQGHPQLVHALLRILRRRGWDALENNADLSHSQLQADLESERAGLRRALLGALEEKTRVLLYRTSLLVGRFTRAVALRLADVPPAVQLPGEHLDTLVGPWLDEVGNEQLRLSPLIAGIGAEVLGAAEQTEMLARS